MSVPTQLSATLTGRYAVEREIGAGGMATVYLARDLKHNRPVALKVLRPELGAVLGAERFLAEIQVTANLQHPNLLPLFDSGDVDGLLYYVMPYVDGESLRARLDREKQLPVDEAVRIATAVAGALDYAHRQGVIHRDLKPENILLHDGQPLVADFGIALAVSNAGGHRITQTGLSLGTPQYMSPEQATGDRAIDGRTDIYSLAAVVYEMLTGEPPHTGSTAQAIVARVLTEKPRPLQATRDAVPRHVAAAVERALAKLPADRFVTAREFAEALSGARPVGLPDGIITPPSFERPDGDARRTWRKPVARFAPWTLVAALAAALAIGAAKWPRPEPQPVTRVELTFGDSVHVSPVPTGANIVFSPDGSRVVFTTGSSNGFRLYLRTMDDMVPKPLEGTERAENPVFSPDGKRIAFTAGAQIRTVPAKGGPPTTVVELGGKNHLATPVVGLSWDDRGDIIFAPADLGLWRVPATGGEPIVVARPDATRGQAGLILPEVLPGSDAALVTISNGLRGDASVRRLGMVDLHTGAVTELGLEGSNPRYVTPGYLVYARTTGDIMAVGFDVRARRVVGHGLPVLGNLLVKNGGAAEFTVSRNGALVAETGSIERRLVIVDRRGSAATLLDTPQNYKEPRLSPDGRRVAMTIFDTGRRAIWIYDLASHTLGRLTNDNNSDRPEWSPDGKRLYYVIAGRTTRAVLARAWDGSGGVDTVVSATKVQEVFPVKDGRHLLLREGAGGTMEPDITIFTLDSVKQSRPFLATPFAESEPRVSPDGHWLAYVGNEGPGSYVYVRPYPGLGRRIQVSTGPGDVDPVWSPDSRELFYRSPTHLIAASLRDGVVTKRDTLFADTYARDLGHPSYDVMPDGQHFIMAKPVDTENRVLLVVNWLAEVKERLAAEAKR